MSIEATLKLKLVPATRDDFLDELKILMGEIFYLKKESWDHFEGPYSLKRHHLESGDFKEWLQCNMVYIKDARHNAEIKPS